MSFDLKFRADHMAVVIANGVGTGHTVNGYSHIASIKGNNTFGSTGSIQMRFNRQTESGGKWYGTWRFIYENGTSNVFHDIGGSIHIDTSYRYEAMWMCGSNVSQSGASVDPVSDPDGFIWVRRRPSAGGDWETVMFVESISLWVNPGNGWNAGWADPINSNRHSGIEPIWGDFANYLLESWEEIIPLENLWIIGENGSVSSSNTALDNLDQVTRTAHFPKTRVIGGRLALLEQDDEPDAVAGAAVIYLRDNGSGKMQIVAKFPTGAVQQLGIEP
jgi:hypothetical protein